MNVKEKLEMLKINNLIDQLIKPNKKQITTGFENFDKEIGGLKRGRIYSISGMMASGKTSFLCNVALNSARQNKNVLIFNLGESNTLLIKKLIGIEKNIDIVSVSNSLKFYEENEKVQNAIDKISKYNIYIDNSFEIKQIYNLCKTLYLNNSLDLVIIDYVQLLSAMEFGVDNKYIEENLIYATIQKIAEAFDVPVLISNQITLPKKRKKILEKDIKIDKMYVDTSFVITNEDSNLILSVMYRDKIDSIDDYAFKFNNKTCRIEE